MCLTERLLEQSVRARWVKREFGSIYFSVNADDETRLAAKVVNKVFQGSIEYIHPKVHDDIIHCNNNDVIMHSWYTPITQWRQYWYRYQPISQISILESELSVTFRIGDYLAQH